MAKGLKEFTHDDLVARAGRWLVNTYGCITAFTEFMSSGTDEIPDAIGWKRNGRSILVECKTSRADYFADMKKTFRMDLNRAIGAERYYMTSSGLIRPEELPEGWGLLEAKGNAVKVIVSCRPRKDMRSDLARTSEMTMLLSALNRVQARILPVKLADWLKWDNRLETPESMLKWVSVEQGRAHQLESTGYTQVMNMADLPIDDVSGELWCPKHDCIFEDCPCVTSGRSDVAYEEVDGVLFGLFPSLHTLVQPCSGSTVLQ
jgi:hypothetical protein